MPRFPLHAPLIIIATLCLTTGCDHSPPPPPTPSNIAAHASTLPIDLPNLLVIDPADTDLLAAIAAARDTLEGTRHRWLHATQLERRQYFIKFSHPLPDGRSEHLWLHPLHWSPFRIEGRLVSRPRLARDLQPGHLVETTRESIIDWLIQLPDRTDGGYTSAVLRQHGRRVVESGEIPQHSPQE